MILNNDNKYRGNLGSTLKLDEYNHVEKPFMEQLKELGWDKGENQVLELKMKIALKKSFRSSYLE